MRLVRRVVQQGVFELVLLHQIAKGSLDEMGHLKNRSDKVQIDIHT